MRLLAESLQPLCRFSWLAVCLSQPPEEMLADFSNPRRPAFHIPARLPSGSLLMALTDYTRQARRTLITNDCLDYFLDLPSPSVWQPSAAAAVSTPLFFEGEIFATLHLGYESRPEDLKRPAELLEEISAAASVSLALVVALERLDQGGGLSQEPEAAASALDLSLDEDMIFHSQAMLDLVRQINALSVLDVPVLLLGETGTGKSMIARHIHNKSLRREGRFVRVNCPSLSGTLFESEMFGHAKGSFTGATKSRMGRFELAHQGTLFLDEVAELSLEMQSKLLQVLDDRSFERVGESVPIMVDMRVVAATNVDIGQALGQGRLRGDLFHRLSVYTIELPPLRQRPDDIAPLAIFLSSRSAARLGLPDLDYSPELLSILSQYQWPGNTRELSNLMTRLVISQNVYGALNRKLVLEILEQSETYFLAQRGELGGRARQSGAEAGESQELVSLADLERQHILKVLAHTKGVIAGPKGAARILGLPRSTLLHRMRKLGLERAPQGEPV